jgi:hypothetical protein
LRWVNIRDGEFFARLDAADGMDMMNKCQGIEVVVGVWTAVVVEALFVNVSLPHRQSHIRNPYRNLWHDDVEGRFIAALCYLDGKSIGIELVIYRIAPEVTVQIHECRPSSLGQVFDRTMLER